MNQSRLYVPKFKKIQEEINENQTTIVAHKIEIENINTNITLKKLGEKLRDEILIIETKIKTKNDEVTKLNQEIERLSGLMNAEGEGLEKLIKEFEDQSVKKLEFYFFPLVMGDNFF